MDWSYLAGFFDGEGNIHFNKIKNKSYQILCRLYSSNENVLLEIKNFIGFGKIYMAKSTGIYELTISDKNSNLIFLKSICAHSILKKRLINFVLENYDFNKGGNNLSFDIIGFHSMITRKNVEKSHRKI